MKNFAYIDPKNDRSAALKALGPKALPIAGGTDLLNLMKERVLEPDALVNIKALPFTTDIGPLLIGFPGLDTTRREESERGLCIGANVTIAAVLEHPLVRSRYPALYEALENIGTPQIRNMSTLGGNLCARPRCWYFRQEWFECSKRGGKKCSAVEGDNEFHAIFGTDIPNYPCVMVHPSSAAPALLVYGARLGTASPEGENSHTVETFFDPADIKRENDLQANELLTHISLPPFHGKSATYEVRHKESHDWPLAMASVAFETEGEKIGKARVCLGAVAPIPWRLPKVEDFLAGKKLTEDVAEKAGAIAVEDAKPLAQNGYKVQLAKVAVKRALLAAATGKRV